MPDSLPDHDPKKSHERLKRALLACETLDAAAREAFLAALDRDDPEIAAEARELLANPTHPALTGPRVAPWIREALEAAGRRADGGAGVGAGTAAPGVGRMVGPYRLVELLGAGGMGVVYRAEQTEPIRREVAVKLLRGGFLPEKIVARFRAEQDALARMEHPGIARIVDAGGDESGTPYLVMELVRGVPITDYCASRRLSPPQRLPLFVDVCRAVQHAHDRGIIHRDLKPANVLVAEVDGRPAVKIIDFGVARIVERGEGADVSLTGEGQLVGTLEYMSPEQAAGRSREVDARTDVYALGAMLYELLTGARPHDLRDKSLSEAVEIIRNESPRPFARTGTSAAGAGDLETITRKALEIDPSRRYAGPGALADDVERYLRAEPIVARPASRAYRLRTFVRRNRGPVAVASGAFLFLAVFAVTMSVLYAGQRRERERAQLEAEKAQAVNQFLRDMLASADPAHMGKDVTVREVMDRSLTALDPSFGGQPEVLAEIQATLGMTYCDLGQYGRGDSLLSASLDLAGTLHGASSADVAAGLHRLAEARFLERRLAEADSLCRLSSRISEAANDLDSKDFWENRLLHGTVLSKLGRLQESEDMLARAADQARAAYGPRSSEYGRARAAHGAVLTALNRPGALDELREGTRVLERSLGPGHPKTIQAGLLLAEQLGFSARLAEAESTARLYAIRSAATLGEDHPWHADAIRTLGEVQLEEDHYADAERNLLAAMELYRSTRGPLHPLLRPTYLALGIARLEQGDFSAAERWLRRSVSLAEKIEAPDHPGRLLSMTGLARGLAEMGEFEEAISVERRAVAGLSKTEGAKSGWTRAAGVNLASMLLFTGDVTGAESALGPGPDGPDAPLTRRCARMLCRARTGRSIDPDSAVAARARALAAARTEPLQQEPALHLLLAMLPPYLRERGLDAEAAACEAALTRYPVPRWGDRTPTLRIPQHAGLDGNLTRSAVVSTK